MTEIPPAAPKLPGMEDTEPTQGQDTEAQVNTNIGIEPHPNIGPDGKIIPGRRRRRKQSKENVSVTPAEVPSPESNEVLERIRKRPLRERADIGELYNTEPRKK